MITIIKKGSDHKKIAESISNFSKKTKKGFDAHKFCGTLKQTKDALEVQKDLRNEWQ